jgi:hypothetical protein
MLHTQKNTVRRYDASTLALLANAVNAAMPGRSVRADAAETAVLARQLEHIQSELFNVEYPVPKALEFIPLDTSVPAGASTFTYREWDVAGRAALIANYAHDLPRVDTTVKEYPKAVKDYGAAYGYTVQDLRAAAFGNIPLDQYKALAAREAIDRKIDEVLSLGDSSVGIEGFLNHSAVPTEAVNNGSWLSASADNIIADVNELVTKVVTQTKDIHRPDTLLLDLARYQRIATLPRATGTDTTVLEFILKSSPYLKSIEAWDRLSTAGSGGAAVALCYKRDPSVVRAVVPVPFEAMPPELRNLEWVTNCLCRVGGTVWYRPLAAVIGTGV